MRTAGGKWALRQRLGGLLLRAGLRPATPSHLTGVPEDQILGIRYGLRGFYDRDVKPLTLTRRCVDGIHLKGGTMLVGGAGGYWGWGVWAGGGRGRARRAGGERGSGRGRGVGCVWTGAWRRAERIKSTGGGPHPPLALHSPPPHACTASLSPRQGTSRGGANIKDIVRRIDLWGLDMVFVVGGNGGNAAANAIMQEVQRQVRGQGWACAPSPKSQHTGFGTGRDRARARFDVACAGQVGPPL